MVLSGKRTLVGFGIDGIQAGLFLYDSCRSGNVGRLAVAEVMPDVVTTLCRAAGRSSLRRSSLRLACSGCPLRAFRARIRPLSTEQIRAVREPGIGLDVIPWHAERSRRCWTT